jgi:hypothetical protein
MLRITWILPGGAVLLAAVLFALAFGAPDRLNSQLMPNVSRPRVAMIERAEHPEWRQFFILGATQRANELHRLRELPDTPVRTDTGPAEPTIARLPADHSNSGPEDNNNETDLNVQSPTATAPVEIDASLSIQVQVATSEEKQPVGFREEKSTVATLEEKPVAIREEKLAAGTPEKKPPVIRTPRRVTPRNDVRVKGVQHVRSRARTPAKQEPPSSQYFFEPFGNQQTRQTSAVNTTSSFGSQRPTPNTNNYFGNQRAGQTQAPNVSNY